MTIEKKVSDTILEQKNAITIGDKVYHVAQPSIATIIKFSGLVSQMPALTVDADNIMYESLNKAKECKIMGEILATLILGAKYKSKFKFFNKEKRLIKKILYDITPTEYSNILGLILNQLMDLGAFMGSISFLNGVNLLKPTKTTHPIQSGRP